MILSELIKILDALLKKELAFEGDNSGFLIGRAQKDVKKILIALDVTDEVIDEAIAARAGLVLVHHPLIYDPLKSITSREKIQLKILKLIENGIAVYAAHTNYDAMPGGLNQLIAEKMRLNNTEILEPLDNFDGAGIGRIGNLEHEKTLEAFFKDLKELLDLEGLQWMSGNPAADIKRIIKRVAVISGGANSSTDFLASPQFIPGTGSNNTTADAVIVGELKYSNAAKIAECGTIVIAIGHAESEKFAINGMFEILKDFLNNNNFSNDIEVLKSKTGYLPWRYSIE